MYGNGSIPSGMFVRHKCDNPKCCNPKHLIPGNHLANMGDARRRGRFETGKRTKPRKPRPSGLKYNNNGNYTCKWSPYRGRMVDLRRAGCTYKEIASWLGCSIGAVRWQLAAADKYGVT